MVEIVGIIIRFSDLRLLFLEDKFKSKHQKTLSTQNKP